MQKGMSDRMRFYPELPVIMNLATGWNEKTSVVRGGRHPAGPRPTAAITPDGRYVGTFAAGTFSSDEDLAEGTRNMTFGPDGLVAHVEKGEIDVPEVMVQRLSAVLP